MEDIPMTIGIRRFVVVLATNLALLMLQAIILLKGGAVVWEILGAVAANTSAYLGFDMGTKAVRAKAGMNAEGTQLVGKETP
jgi:hypothetical protein